MTTRNALVALGVGAPAAALIARHVLAKREPGAGGATEVKILDPDETVKVGRDGPASSVQEAEIVVGRDYLDRIWTPDSLELLARGYWLFLSRTFLKLVSVTYADDSRTVKALGLIPLLRFRGPQFETSEGTGQVTWPVDQGVLVAQSGRGKGHLRVSVRRCDRDGFDDEADAELDRVRLIARVEVENFYPGLRGSGRFSRWGAWLYAQTQLRIHVVVCNAFLRSLPNLDFPDVDTTSMPSDIEPELKLKTAAAR